MKNWSFIIVAFTLACGGNETANNLSESQPNEPAETVEEVSISEEVIHVEETVKPIPFFIEDFPTKWIQLNESNSADENWIIYNYCHAETPILEFIGEKGDTYTLNINYGQDGWVGSIDNFTAQKKVVDMTQVVKGSFDLTSGMGDGEKSEVSFVWNQDKMFCKFEGLDFDFPFFVSEQNKSNYKEVSEDCSELWEE